MSLIYLFGILVALNMAMVYGEESQSEIGINWWDILKADVTCCPANTNERSCDAEAGSSCLWLAEDDPIAVKSGYQCVGQAYYQCKTKDITACCAPACKANVPAPAPPSDPNTPAPAPPECGPITPFPTTAAPTTAAPSLAPTYTVCDTEDEVDIVFLMDESGSVSTSEWDTVTSFVERLITFDVSPKSYVALYEYASLSGFSNFLTFTGPNSDETQQQSMIDALQNNRWSQVGLTETWDAVNRVLDDFWYYNNNQLTDADGNIVPCGDCAARPDVLFLVTDGNPTDTVKLNVNGQEVRQFTCGGTSPTLEERILASGVDIFIVLIDADGTVDPSMVECLDSQNQYKDVILLQDFTSAAFTDIEIRIREKICSGQLTLDQGLVGSQQQYQYADGSYGRGPIPASGGGGKGCSNDPGSENPCPPNAAIADEILAKSIEIDDGVNNGLTVQMIGILAFTVILGCGAVYYYGFKGGKDEYERIHNDGVEGYSTFNKV